MSAKKTKQPSLVPMPPIIGRFVNSLFTSKQGRSLLGGSLLVFGFGVAIYFCWKHVEKQVLATSDYRVDLEDITITTPPTWVHANIGEVVFRDLSVEGPISIMDGQVAKRFKDAFTLHPWVEHVIQVSTSFPAKVHVELKYREPACIVAASGRWFPVDIKGYVLPGNDFSPSDLQGLPKVVGIQTLPVISDGVYWNDKQVDAAARIGAVLRPCWQEFQLDTIRPAQLPQGINRNQKDVKDFELITKNGTVILWGESLELQADFNDREAQNAPSNTHLVLSNAEKATRLKWYFEQHGTLDLPGNQMLDLRITTTKVANRQQPGRQN